MMVRTMVTIGPNSCSPEDVKKFSQFTNIFRVNGSHSDLIWHRNAVKIIRETCDNAFILMDIPGIKPRTANTRSENITSGDVITFGIKKNHDKIRCIKLTKELPDYNQNIKNFSLNDGQFLFDVTEVGKGYVTGRAKESFNILPRKGINIPGSNYDERKQEVIYRNFIENISSMDVDALGLSFVQTGDLVEAIRKKFPKFLLISKVENSEGLKNVKSIAKVSDAVMIDRGDLGAEVGFTKLFDAIEHISAVTKSMGRPLIMATENLESMLERGSPSKSEVVSLAHSINIGVDCIMLSEETAVSKNKHLIVGWLNKFLNENNLVKLPSSKLGENRFGFVWESVRHSEGLPTIIVSKSGYAVFNFNAVRPNDGFTVVTPNPKIQKLSMLYRTEIKTIKDEIRGDKTLDAVIPTIQNNAPRLFRESKQILAIYVASYGETARANTLTVFDRKDFL